MHKLKVRVNKCALKFFFLMTIFNVLLHIFISWIPVAKNFSPLNSSNGMLNVYLIKVQVFWRGHKKMEVFTWGKYLKRPLSRLWCKFSDQRRLENAYSIRSRHENTYSKIHNTLAGHILCAQRNNKTEVCSTQRSVFGRYIPPPQSGR